MILITEFRFPNLTVGQGRSNPTLCRAHRAELKKWEHKGVLLLCPMSLVCNDGSHALGCRPKFKQELEEREILWVQASKREGGIELACRANAGRKVHFCLPSQPLSMYCDMWCSDLHPNSFTTRWKRGYFSPCLARDIPGNGSDWPD